jgi:hypothetical protein
MTVDGPPDMLLDIGPVEPPADAVRPTVEVDRSRCQATDEVVDSRLRQLEASGLDTTVYELIAYSSIFFAGAALDHGHGTAQAELRAACELMDGWGLKAVRHATEQRPVLVVTGSGNSRADAQRSEVLATGVALRTARSIYPEIPYAAWRPSPGLAPHDLQAFTADQQPIRIEARGRMDRAGVTKAVAQVYDKFSAATADFARAAGVIFCPRTGNAPRKADVLIVDPDGDAMANRQHEQLRSIVAHYAPFFQAQGGVVERFGARLRELADAPDTDFAAYLAAGDPILNDPVNWVGRVSFRRGGATFKGTAWEGVAWPAGLTGIEPPAGGGYFYWGLWTEVIDALRRGQVAALGRLQVKRCVVKRPDRLFILLEDGAALAWVPSERDLRPSAFEDDPPLFAATGGSNALRTSTESVGG